MLNQNTIIKFQSRIYNVIKLKTNVSTSNLTIRFVFLQSDTAIDLGSKNTVKKELITKPGIFSSIATSPTNAKFITRGAMIGNKGSAIFLTKELLKLDE